MFLVFLVLVFFIVYSFWFWSCCFWLCQKQRLFVFDIVKNSKKKEKDLVFLVSVLVFLVLLFFTMQKRNTFCFYCFWLFVFYNLFLTMSKTLKTQKTPQNRVFVLTLFYVVKNSNTTNTIVFDYLFLTTCFWLLVFDYTKNTKNTFFFMK